MGEQDYMFLPFVKKIVRFHKSSSLITIIGSGHVVNIDQSEQFNNTLLSYLLKDYLVFSIELIKHNYPSSARKANLS